MLLLFIPLRWLCSVKWRQIFTWCFSDFFWEWEKRWWWFSKLLPPLLYPSTKLCLSNTISDHLFDNSVSVIQRHHVNFLFRLNLYEIVAYWTPERHHNSMLWEHLCSYLTSFSRLTPIIYVTYLSLLTKQLFPVCWTKCSYYTLVTLDGCCRLIFGIKISDVDW